MGVTCCGHMMKCSRIPFHSPYRTLARTYSSSWTEWCSSLLHVTEWYKLATHPTLCFILCSVPSAKTYIVFSSGQSVRIVQVAPIQCPRKKVVHKHMQVNMWYQRGRLWKWQRHNWPHLYSQQKITEGHHHIQTNQTFDDMTNNVYM